MQGQSGCIRSKVGAQKLAGCGKIDRDGDNELGRKKAIFDRKYVFPFFFHTSNVTKLYINHINATLPWSRRIIFCFL